MKKCVLVAIVGLGLLVMGSEARATMWQEDFEGYANGTVLSAVNATNVTTVASVDNWDVANSIHSGIRSMAIGEEGDGNDYVTVPAGSGRTVSWKKDTAIATAFSSGSLQVLEFSFWNDNQNWDDLIEVWLGACSDGGGTSIKKMINIRTGSTSYRNVGLYTNAAGVVGEADNAQDFPALTWIDVKVDIDTAANAGQGKVSVAYKQRSATTWTLEPALQNVQIGLLNTPATWGSVNEPSEWGGIYFDIMNGGRVDNIKAYAVPEPATLLLVLSGVLTLTRIRRK